MKSLEAAERRRADWEKKASAMAARLREQEAEVGGGGGGDGGSGLASTMSLCPLSFACLLDFHALRLYSNKRFRVNCDAASVLYLPTSPREGEVRESALRRSRVWGGAGVLVATTARVTCVGVATEHAHVLVQRFHGRSPFPRSFAEQPHPCAAPLHRRDGAARLARPPVHSSHPIATPFPRLLRLFSALYFRFLGRSES